MASVFIPYNICAIVVSDATSWRFDQLYFQQANTLMLEIAGVTICNAWKKTKERHWNKADIKTNQNLAKEHTNSAPTKHSLSSVRISQSTSPIIMSHSQSQFQSHSVSSPSSASHSRRASLKYVIN